MNRQVVRLKNAATNAATPAEALSGLNRDISWKAHLGLTDLFKNIVGQIIIGHRVIDPVLDVKTGIPGRLVHTLRTIPVSPGSLHRLVQASGVIWTKGVPFPFFVDWLSFRVHFQTPARRVSPDIRKRLFALVTPDPYDPQIDSYPLTHRSQDSR